MIKQMGKIFLVLSLLVGLEVAAKAQFHEAEQIDANIPHAFVVKDTTLPAGKYMIKVIDENEPNVLEMRSADGRIAVLFDTESAQAKRPSSKSELVFDKIGDKYFLSQIFLGGDNSGNQLIKSRMQRKLEDGGMKAESYSVSAFKRPFKRLARAVKKVS